MIDVASTNDGENSISQLLYFYEGRSNMNAIWAISRVFAACSVVWRHSSCR